MNKKQLIIILTAAVLVIILAMLIVRQDARSWQSPAEGDRTALLADFDVNTVREIVIADHSGSVSLRQQDGRWRVVERDNYPADFRRLRNALLELVELNIAQRIIAGRSQHGRLGLLRPDDADRDSSGVVVEFFDSDRNRLAGMILGNKHFPKEDDDARRMYWGPQANGRYLMLDDGKEQPVLVTAVLSSLVARPVEWLDKSFIRLDKINEIELEDADGKTIWQIARENNDGILRLGGVDPELEEVDATKISGIASSLQYLTFEDVVTGEAAAEFTPENKLKLTGANGIVIEFATASRGQDVLFRVAVAADFPEARVAQENESPEDKEKLDREFNEQLRESRRQLADYRQFEGFVYKTGKTRFGSALEPRDALVKPKPQEEKSEQPAAGEPSS